MSSVPNWRASVPDAILVVARPVPPKPRRRLKLFLKQLKTDFDWSGAIGSQEWREVLLV